MVNEIIPHTLRVFILLYRQVHVKAAFEEILREYHLSFFFLLY